MQSLIIVTFSWSSDAAVMCFFISLHSFVVRSAFDSTFRLVVAEIYWRRVSNDGSYTCDGIPMDALITAAARALAAAGDPDRGLVADVECERQEPLAPFQLQRIEQVDVAGRRGHAIAARATYVQAYPKPLDAPVMNQTL
jgi:hypothetical protein